MRPKVWLTHPLHPEASARLEAAVEVILSPDGAGLPVVAAAIVGSKITFDGDLLDRLGPDLKVLARTGIGADNIDLAAATQRGILVVNTPDAPSESTAEHAVALLLALSKRVVAGDRSIRGAGLTRAQLLGMELKGRVLGVVGFGRIGRRVAEICALGLGMQILAFDPYLDPAQLNAPGVEVVDDLNVLLSRADVVTLHTPLTSETRHLLGERELRRMKPGSYLINASRGAVLDQDALLRVLQSGHLAGAALDVFPGQPPSPGDPLLNLPNVVVTPHIGSYTESGVKAMGLGAADQVLQVLRGERPRFLLNPEAWPGRSSATS